MSEKSIARRTTAQVSFAGVDITKDILPYLLSMTFTDNDEDEADDLQIKLQDREGLWACQWLVDIINAAASPASVSYTQSEVGTGTKYTVVAEYGLNVRAGPGTKYARLGALPYGSVVDVLSISGNWGTIIYNDKTGYLYVPYLKQGGTSAGSPSSVSADPNATDLKIQAAIVRQNWNGDGKDDVLDCGIFELDTVDASGPPSVVTIRATSLPYKSPIRQTEKSKAWENYCLSGIVREIAGKYGMSFLYLSDSDPRYERAEQFKISDIKFLETLCHNAGISLKVTNQMLICFDQAAYEEKASVLRIKRNDKSYMKYKLNVSTADSEYQSCRVSYTDPATGKSISGIAYVEDYKEDAKDNKRLEITEKAASIAEAENLAKKRLRMHNKYSKTVEFTMPGNPGLAAGLNFELEGWGAWDRKYAIYQATHTIGPSGYITKIEGRAVLEGY